jgi:hypothetical protein
VHKNHLNTLNIFN